MGKHDATSHTLHIPKGLKFKQAKPATNQNLNQTVPQVPRQGHSSHNMFK